MKRKKRNRVVPILILSGILIVAFIFGVRIIRNRAFSYGYDQKLDYKYEFNPEFAQIQNIQLNNNRLDLSDLPAGFHTVFLEMNLKSTLKGFANEPEIKMIAGTDTLSQNFECRVKGIRYINISQFIQNERNEIQFEFNGCKLKSNEIKLIAYQNIPTQNQKYLILAPHPDDAEIAAYGLYASHPDSTFIATVTAGDAGSMNYDEVYADSTVHYIKKGKIRAWNSITVPMLGGIAPENAINLGYFDAMLIFYVFRYNQGRAKSLRKHQRHEPVSFGKLHASTRFACTTGYLALAGQRHQVPIVEGEADGRTFYLPRTRFAQRPQIHHCGPTASHERIAVRQLSTLAVYQPLSNV
jgi:hypothetical protein